MTSSSSFRVLTPLLASIILASSACGVFGGDSDPGPPAEVTPDVDATTPPVTGPTTTSELTDDLGIFVSTQGSDSASGTHVAPLATIHAGIDKAKSVGKRVYVCVGTYKEALVLADSVSMVGGLECAGNVWTTGAARTRIESPTSPAVTARSMSAPTRIEGFELIAPDLAGAPATDTTGTSIALDARDVHGLVISASLLHGGTGAPGTDGVAGAVNSRTASSDGHAAFPQHERICSGFAAEICTRYTVPGPAGGVTTCAIGPAGGAGGAGGDGRILLSGQSSGVNNDQRGRPFTATAATAKGGLNTDPNGGLLGLPGDHGSNGGDGHDGTNGTWTLSVDAGFVRGNGTAGAAGDPGQGGGGGAGTGNAFSAGGASSPPPSSQNYQTGTGGSGGGGGCAGQAGTPGTGGGASIGALIVNSDITFEYARVESSDGGRAGLGNLGTLGTMGGFGGPGAFATASTLTPFTGPGGTGGSGGNGGNAGHGAPGPSLALVYTGPKPTLTSSDLAPGKGGAGQPELKRASGSTLPAVTGISEAEHVFP